MKEAEVGAKSFAVLAILAILFAGISVSAVIYLQDQMNKQKPVCGECQYIMESQCFDYECCKDSHCKETQMCIGHVCYDLDCSSEQIIKNHGCVNKEQNYTKNTETPYCKTVLDCEKNQTCENNSCKDLKCDRFEIIENHTCKEVECKKDDQCNKSSFCSQNTCQKLDCSECQFIENHSCFNYECCDYSDCEKGQTCQENKCINQTCPEGTHFFAGKCIEYKCFEDSDCNDREKMTKDICVEPGTPRASCEHYWKELNFTGNTTLTLHVNQSAYYEEKRSRVKLITLKDEYGYFWTGQAKIDYSLWASHEESWVEIPPSEANKTTKKQYWANITRQGERLSVIVNSINENAATAKIRVKYTKV